MPINVPRATTTACILRLVSSAAGAVMLFACVSASSAQTPSAPARVIVKFKATALLSKAGPTAPGLSRASVLGKRLGVAMTDGPALSEDTQVVMSQQMSSIDLAQRLAREPDVDYAVPDRRRKPLAAPNDPLYGNGVPGNGPAVGQ